MQRPQPPTEEMAAVPLALPYREFICLLALVTSMTAMSIDIMLPSLPEIGRHFAVAEPNDRQLVVIAYMLGMAGGQLVWGPASDRLGRKPPLLAGLAVFIAATVAATLATSFAMLLAARFVQGLGGAAGRTIATAIVRDLFSGRQMAKVMSTIMMVFIMVPILAPGVGQIAASLGSWRSPFLVLLVAGSIAAAWAALRLPETHPASGSVSLSAALRLVLGSPVTMGYCGATCAMFGCLVSYISSAQQIFGEAYGMGAAFPLAFGGVACGIALAHFLNARLVPRFGMRRLSHAALVAFLATSLLLALLCALTWPPLAVVLALVCACFFLYGLTQANFNAIAMQPVGQAAGMAAAVLGFTMTTVGALAGGLIARLFDGSALPLAAGFTVLAAAALLAIYSVEGRQGMFRGE